MRLIPPLALVLALVVTSPHAAPPPPYAETPALMQACSKGDRAACNKLKELYPNMPMGPGAPGTPGGPGGPGGMNDPSAPSGIPEGLFTRSFGRPGWSSLKDSGLCPTKKVVLAAKPPTTAEYGALIAAAKAKARKKAKVGAIEVERVLGADWDAATAANLGASLVDKAIGSPALFATALAAERAPDDPLIASNLGVLLAGMDELADAHRALLYAETLAPEDPVIIANRGWVHYRAADPGNAKKHFQILREAKLAPVLLGLGLLDLCADKPSARDLLLESLAISESEVARAASALADPALPPLAREEIKLPLKDPTIPFDFNRALEALPASLYLQADVLASLNEVNKQLLAVTTKHAAAKVPFSPEARALNQHVHEVYEPKLKKLFEDFMAEWTPLRDALEAWKQAWGQMVRDATACGGNKGCGDRVYVQFCENSRAAFEQQHALAHRLIDTRWPETKRTLNEYVGFALPLLRSLRDQLDADMRTLQLEQTILGYQLGFAQVAFSWNHYAGYFSNKRCDPPKAAIPDKPPGLMDMLEGVRALACAGVPIPPVPLGGTFTVQLTCKGATVNWLPAVTASYERDFETGQTTIFLGTGITLKQVGPVAAAARLGAYWIVEDGRVTDLGPEAELSLALDPLISKGIGGRMRLMSGPKWFVPLPK